MRSLRSASAQLNSLPANLRTQLLTAGGLQLSAYQTARQDITASVVMQDTQLNIGLGISGYWLIEVMANIVITNAAQNIRWTFSAPDGLVLVNPGVNGETLGRSFLSISGAASQEDAILNIGTTVNGGTTSAWTSITARFGVHVGSTGTLMFQFAQGVSGAPATSLLGGSIMRAQYLMNNVQV